MNILKGFIKDIRYAPLLHPSSIPEYDLTDFDVNASRHYGLIRLGTPGNSLAYARWVSPKRTRSYPFARLYDIFHFSAPKVAIIPIIKDEGLDGDNDRINFMTFSWMSLLNVYIILAWYDRAERKVGDRRKITRQRLNTDYVRAKLSEISTYHLSALHWNTTHFERDFETIYLQAVQSYQNIGQSLGVAMHSDTEHLKTLAMYKRDGKFNLEVFKEMTLQRSLGAARRETLTSHRLESLSDGEKNLLYVSNYLGGVYHLAPDEVYSEKDYVVIQESKNTSRSKLPSVDDIKDGLFKLILYTNLDKLIVDETEQTCVVRLKITGAFSGLLMLPHSNEAEIRYFCTQNRFSVRQTRLIERLNEEALTNSGLNITLMGQV